MTRSILIGLLFITALHGFAQTDSLTISDSIGVNTQRRNRQMPSYGYQYYGASQLAGKQLRAILKHSPDPLARELAAQSQRLNWISTGLVVGSFGLFLGSFSSTGRRTRSNGSLTLAAYGALFGSFIPQTMSSNRLARAVALHNRFLRNRADGYLPPVVYESTRQWPLLLADTVAVRRHQLTYRYLYRGIAVNAGSQLNRLTASLNDREVNDGIRYVRTLNRVGGIASGIGQGLLVGYLTTRLLTRGYRRNTSAENELLTTGLICIGANFVLTRHTNRIQRRWVSRYNDRLKENFSAQ